MVVETASSRFCKKLHPGRCLVVSRTCWCNWKIPLLAWSPEIGGLSATCFAGVKPNVFNQSLMVLNSQTNPVTALGGGGENSHRPPPHTENALVTILKIDQLNVRWYTIQRGSTFLPTDSDWLCSTNLQPRFSKTPPSTSPTVTVLENHRTKAGLSCLSERVCIWRWEIALVWLCCGVQKTQIRAALLTPGTTQDVLRTNSARRSQRPNANLTRQQPEAN